MLSLSSHPDAFPAVSVHATTRGTMHRLLKRTLSPMMLVLMCTQINPSTATAEELYFNAKNLLHSAKNSRTKKKKPQNDQHLRVIAHKGGWQSQANVMPGAHKNTLDLTPNDYTRIAEQKYGIPSGLLSALAFVESKCTPYAVHAKGQSHYFKTKSDAVHFVNTMRAQGVRNIDVGYMQLNVPSHLSQFGSVDQMLDIGHNIHYAARLLKQLYKRYGNWPDAVQRYRSVFCEESRRYQAKVYRVWGAGQGLRHNYARRVVASMAVQHYHTPTKRNPNPRVYAVSHAQPKVQVPTSTAPLHKVHTHTEQPKVWQTTYAGSFLKGQQKNYAIDNIQPLKKVSILAQLTKPFAYMFKA